MPVQYWESLLNTNQNNAVSGAAYASSTTITDVSPAPQLTLPANFLQVGSTIRLTAAGTYSNTATPTLILGFYYGGVAGVALATAGTITTVTGATAWPFHLEWEGTVRTVGAAGTIMGNGKLFLANALTAFGLTVAAPAVIPMPSAAIATVAIDTTTAKAITLGATWGTNSASNTLTCTKFLVESMA